MIDRDWEERAREVMCKVVSNDYRPFNAHQEEMRALLAEPAEPAYRPGDEIPGWVAAKLASEGRDDEVDWVRWKGPEPRSGLQWRPLRNDPPSLVGAFIDTVDAGYRFRLRPAPTQPEPEPEWVCTCPWHTAAGMDALKNPPAPTTRAAFEEAMARLECRTGPAVAKTIQQAWNAIQDAEDALRALANEVFKP